MGRIWIRKLRIGIQMFGMRFEWLEFGFECFEYRLTGLNLHSNASNLVRVIRIGIRMLWMPVEWLEFTFEWFKSLSNCLNLDLDASYPFQMVRIPIWIFPISFKFGLECFESLSNGSKLHSNASKWLEWLDFPFECFESLSNGLNLHLNVSNPFWMVRISGHSNVTNLVRIWIGMLRIPFKWFDSFPYG